MSLGSRGAFHDSNGNFLHSLFPLPFDEYGTSTVTFLGWQLMNQLIPVDSMGISFPKPFLESKTISTAGCLVSNDSELFSSDTSVFESQLNVLGARESIIKANKRIIMSYIWLFSWDKLRTISVISHFVALFWEIPRNTDEKLQLLLCKFSFKIPNVNVMGYGEHEVAGDQESSPNELSLSIIIVVKSPNAVVGKHGSVLLFDTVADITKVGVIVVLFFEVH